MTIVFPRVTFRLSSIWDNIFLIFTKCLFTQIYLSGYWRKSAIMVPFWSLSCNKITLHSNIEKRKSFWLTWFELPCLYRLEWFHYGIIWLNLNEWMVSVIWKFGHPMWFLLQTNWQLPCICWEKIIPKWHCENLAMHRIFLWISCHLL